MSFPAVPESCDLCGTRYAVFVAFDAAKQTAVCRTCAANLPCRL